MNTIISSLNSLMTVLFRGLFWPFRSLDPVWAIIFISVLSGLVMLWIFARVSNQDAIRVVRERIRGNLLGVRLFQHDVGVVLSLQGRIFRDLLSYLRFSMAPVAIMLIPVLLILIQLNLFFSLRPLNAGEQTLIKVQMPEASVMGKEIRIVEADAFVVETPAVRMPAIGEVAWRLRAEKPGRHTVLLEIEGRQYEKELVVGGDWTETSGLRTASWLDLLLYSGEDPLPPDSLLESIEVVYPYQSLSILGLGTDWLVLFFVVSLISAFALKGFFGIEI